MSIPSTTVLQRRVGTTEEEEEEVLEGRVKEEPEGVVRTSLVKETKMRARDRLG